MSLLNRAGFKCPTPIINKQNKTINDYREKN